MSTLSGPFWDERLMIDQHFAPDILAIGDSWFWYPVNNLLNPLFNVLQRDYCILAYGDNGAESVDYVGYYRNQVTEALDAWKGSIKAVFISGGGNDFAGLDDMFKIVRPDCAGVTDVDGCFNAGQPQAIFREVTRAYTRLIGIVRNVLPDCPIILHNYDRAIPTGKGFLGWGNWLRAPLDQAHVARRLQQQIVNRLIFELTGQLKTHAAADPAIWIADSARMVDITDPADIQGPGTLSAEQWANELHPTPGGFQKIARTWKKTLKEAELI